MRKIVIHIGAPKTASTTLQMRLFEKHSGLHFFGEEGAGCEADSDRDTINSMIFDDDLYFSRAECARLFETHRRLDPEKTLIYSDGDVMTSRVPVLCAQRLHELLPEAVILLVIRNQLTAIPSFYANHGAYLKPAPPSYFRRYVSFDDWMQFCTMFIKYSPLASFFYNKILRIYADLFGKDRIEILMFEEFILNKETFVRKLCRILEIEPLESLRLLSGAHERKRNTSRMLRYHQFRSWFFWGWKFGRYVPHRAVDKWRSFLKGGSRANGFMSDKWKNKIIELYREDNTKLAKDYNLPLKKYQYPLSDI